MRAPVRERDHFGIVIVHCCSVPGVSLERDHLRSIPVKPARRQTAQLFNVSAGNGELGGKQVRLAAGRFAELTEGRLHRDRPVLEGEILLGEVGQGRGQRLGQALDVVIALDQPGGDEIQSISASFSLSANASASKASRGRSPATLPSQGMQICTGVSPEATTVTGVWAPR